MKYVGGFVVMVASVFLRLYVLQRLWLWFVVPTWGIPVPGMAMMYGLLVIKALIWVPVPDGTKDETWGQKLGVNILHSLLAWGMGAMCHWLAGGAQ